jgi:hypothetical protein
MPKNDYVWNPIDSAPFDEDVNLEVTDGRGAPYCIRLGEFEQGNTARSHSGEVEAVPCPARETMTAASRRPGRARQPVAFRGQLFDHLIGGREERLGRG